MFFHSINDLIEPLGYGVQLFFLGLDLDMAECKPDGRTANSEHRNREHEQAWVIIHRHHVNTVYNQVPSGDHYQYHEDYLRPFLGAEFPALFHEGLLRHMYLYTQFESRDI